ncbi:MAG: tRNA (N6-threonylcarbamoyladenosine(37)-N6)-methyltransferase TrmO [Granulosicoccaceae bacterium]
MQAFKFQAIATVRSDYQEKFAIPRQPNLAPAARAWVDVDPRWASQGALDGIELASHVWMQFVFHAVSNRCVSAKVRPPRLGGNERVGVFATRSTHRPNPIGLSVVRLLAVERHSLLIGGADLLDGTPVLDIKPYLPWSDSVPDAEHSMAVEAPPSAEVFFATEAERQLRRIGPSSTRLSALIEQSLGQDPRPAYQREDTQRVYGVRLAGFNVRWRHPETARVEVLSVEPSD